MGCGASRFSLKRGRASVSPSAPTSQTGPPQSVEVWTEKENKPPEIQGSDSRPSEKVTAVAEIEVNSASKSSDRQSTNGQPDLQTETHHKDSSPTLQAQEGTRKSDTEEEKRESTAIESKTSTGGTAADEAIDTHSVHSHDKEVKAVSLPETKKNGEDVAGSLASASTKSMGQIRILSKLDEGSNQLKSMSATIVLAKSDTHNKEEDGQSESKEDNVNPVSHTSLLSSKSKENVTMDHTSEKTVEETHTIETEDEKIETAETEGQPGVVEEVHTTETKNDEVSLEKVHETVHEEVQATEATDGEIPTLDSVGEVHAMDTPIEKKQTIETTVEETPAAVEEVQTTDTKVDEVNTIEATIEETHPTGKEACTTDTTTVNGVHPSETTVKEPTSEEKHSTEGTVEEKHSTKATVEATEATVEEKHSTEATVEEKHSTEATVEEKHSTEATVEEKHSTEPTHEEVKPTETPSQGDSAQVSGEDPQSETKADGTITVNQEEDEKSRRSSSQSELNKSTATGSKSSLGKTERNQKVEIDHSTGQSEASIIEAVEKSEQTQTPVAANT